MNTENNDMTLTPEDLKITAKISARAFYDRQIGTANRIKTNKAKVIDISREIELINSINTKSTELLRELELLNFISTKPTKLLRELELLNFTNAVDSQNLREFDLILSAIKYVVYINTAVRSLSKNAGHLINTEFLENLWEKIFGYACSMTYQEYLLFFKLFLDEYGTLTEANK